MSGLDGYRVADIELTTSRPPAGLRLTELAWPPSAHLLALRRDGRIIPATPTTVIEKGDRLSILLPAAQAGRIGEMLARSPSASASAHPSAPPAG